MELSPIKYTLKLCFVFVSIVFFFPLVFISSIIYSLTTLEELSWTSEIKRITNNYSHNFDYTIKTDINKFFITNNYYGVFV